MSIWGFGCSGKSNTFVAFGELNLEKGDQSLNVIVSLDFEAKWSYKWDIIFGAGLNVDFFQHTRIGNHLISIYDINQRLLESYTPNTRHVKSVDIIPPVYFIVFVLTIFDGSDIQSGPVGEHQAIRG